MRTKKMKKTRPKLIVVVPMWRGLVEEVFVFNEEEKAYKKQEELRKHYGDDPGVDVEIFEVEPE